MIGGVYYYNASTVFADQPIQHDLQQRLNELPIAYTEDENLPSLEGITAARKQRLAADSAQQPSSNDAPSMSTDSPSLSAATTQAVTQGTSGSADAATGNPQDLEEEASQQGAFNEETGEINWDCPCLGGMAHGPCGPQFREAFSCFVFSKEEPKGIDCIDRFKYDATQCFMHCKTLLLTDMTRGMQDCFREHPDIYGAELSDDDDSSPDELPDVPGAETPRSTSPSSDAAPAAAKTAAPQSSPASKPAPQSNKKQTAGNSTSETNEPAATTSFQRAGEAKAQVARDHGDSSSESDELVPKAWHDARDKNESK